MIDSAWLIRSEQFIALCVGSKKCLSLVFGSEQFIALCVDGKRC